MIDMSAVREAYKRKEISKKSSLMSEHNMANRLTKHGPFAAFAAVFRPGKDINPVQRVEHPIPGID